VELVLLDLGFVFRSSENICKEVLGETEGVVREASEYELEECRDFEGELIGDFRGLVTGYWSKGHRYSGTSAQSCGNLKSAS